MEESRNQRLGELLAELAGGDTSALGGVKDLLEKLLYAIANKYFRNSADVEDAVEDFYFYILKKACRFKENINAYGWLIKTYENFLKNKLRRKNVERKYLKKEKMFLRAESKAVDEEYLENHLYLKEIFSRLTAEEQFFVEYHFWAELTLRELEVMLGKPRTTIAYKIKRLEERLKTEELISLKTDFYRK